MLLPVWLRFGCFTNMALTISSIIAYLSSQEKKGWYCGKRRQPFFSFKLGLVVPDFPMEIPDLPAPPSYLEPLPVTATRGCLFPLATAITLTLLF